MSEAFDEIQKILDKIPDEPPKVRVKLTKWYYHLSPKRRKQRKIMQFLVERVAPEAQKKAFEDYKELLIYGRVKR